MVVMMMKFQVRMMRMMRMMMQYTTEKYMSTSATSGSQRLLFACPAHSGRVVLVRPDAAAAPPSARRPRAAALRHRRRTTRHRHRRKIPRAFAEDKEIDLYEAWKQAEILQPKLTFEQIVGYLKPLLEARALGDLPKSAETAMEKRFTHIITHPQFNKSPKSKAAAALLEKARRQGLLARVAAAALAWQSALAEAAVDHEQAYGYEYDPDYEEPNMSGGRM
jgi:hypothetical protein